MDGLQQKLQGQRRLSSSDDNNIFTPSRPIASSQTCTSFLNLPPEIRLQIYSRLFRGAKAVIGSPLSCHKITSILESNRLLRQEAVPLFYQLTAFGVRSLQIFHMRPACGKFKHIRQLSVPNFLKAKVLEDAVIETFESLQRLDIVIDSSWDGCLAIHLVGPTGIMTGRVTWTRMSLDSEAISEEVVDYLVRDFCAARPWSLRKMREPQRYKIVLVVNFDLVPVSGHKTRLCTAAICTTGVEIRQERYGRPDIWSKYLRDALGLQRK